MIKKRSKKPKDKYAGDEHLIINRPEAMSSLRRKSEITVTTVGWLAWAFICRPILIVLLWFIRLRRRPRACPWRKAKGAVRLRRIPPQIFSG